MKVVLFQPEIPQNTGNIVRTCAVTGNDLILVRPLGFSTASRRLKRAGLDYWDGVDVQMIDDLMAYLDQTPSKFYFFSSKAKKNYTDIDYSPTDHIIFGSESAGLPESYLQKWDSQFYRIPMKQGARCLNLASSAAIVIYEAWRQMGYK